MNRKVSYNGVSHGYWCNTKTYPMKCQYCHEKVFYFSCDHGCKVFFDELGDPWPEHYCEEYQKHMTKTSENRIHTKLSFIESRHRQNKPIPIEATDINQKGLVLQFDKPLDRNNSDAYIREEGSVNLNWETIIYRNTLELHRGNKENIREGRYYLVVVNVATHDGRQRIKKHVRFTTVRQAHPSIEVIE